MGVACRRPRSGDGVGPMPAVFSALPRQRPFRRLVNRCRLRAERQLSAPSRIENCSAFASFVLADRNGPYRDVSARRLLVLSAEGPRRLSIHAGNPEVTLTLSTLGLESSQS